MSKKTQNPQSNIGAVSTSKGLRGSSCRNTPMFERATQLNISTETLIDDTLCYAKCFIINKLNNSIL
jgi:hypothetical protein